MGTTNFTKINSSVLEVLYMVGRIEAQNEIMHFKLNSTGVSIPKFDVEKRKTKIYEMPSEEQISHALNNAKINATSETNKFGMGFDETIIENYVFPYKRHIDTDTDAETDFSSDIEDDYMNNKSYSELDDSASIASNLEEISETEEIIDDTSEDKAFVEIVSESGTVKKIRKSSLAWILSEKCGQISNDRLKRVQSIRNSTLRKRARQMNDS